VKRKGKEIQNIKKREAEKQRETDERTKQKNIERIKDKQKRKEG
jgi:hypothetical protein